MSPNGSDRSEDQPLDAAVADEELAEDEEWDDDDADASSPRTMPSPRRLFGLIVVILIVLLVLLPVAVLVVPPVSDVLLLPRTGPDLVLAPNEVPAGLMIEIDGPKSPDLGLDDSQASRARKAQLTSSGFGGGWLRTYKTDAQTGLTQLASGVSAYRSSEGAHVELLRTMSEIANDPKWKAFSIGASFGNESSAYEQQIQGGHAVLIYYRYANLLGQVLVSYWDQADKAFAGASAQGKALAQRQVDKERGARFRP